MYLDCALVYEVLPVVDSDGHGVVLPCVCHAHHALLQFSNAVLKVEGQGYCALRGGDSGFLRRAEIDAQLACREVLCIGECCVADDTVALYFGEERSETRNSGQPPQESAVGICMNPQSASTRNRGSHNKYAAVEGASRQPSAQLVPSR